MNRKIKTSICVVMFTVLVISICYGYYYFRVRTNRPEYALSTLQDSIENHDVKKFYRVVNMDSLLNSVYSDFIAGIITSNNLMTDEAKENIKDFTQLIQEPLINSLKASIDSYIESGDLNVQEDVGLEEFFRQIGIDKIEFRRIEDIRRNELNANEATADIIIFQSELEKEFPMKVTLNRSDKNGWQLTHIKNFLEYIVKINQIHRRKLEEYLMSSSDINLRHDAVIREAAQKQGWILSQGNLGEDSTRRELKTLMMDTVKKDWELRKQELNNLYVPYEARTIQNLYMKICDLSIDYAEYYARWMEDKNASTIRTAEDKLHQAQTLMNEAAILAKRMAG